MVIFGDYHTHTIYSGGRFNVKHATGTILENAMMAKQKGLKQIAITEHGFSHKLYGVKRKNIDKMRKEIDEAKKTTGIDILLGIEANIISSEGDVDLTDEDINDGSFFGTGDLYIRFNADGTCVQVNIYDDYIVDGEVAYEGEIDILKGTWALSEDKLTLTEDGISVTFDILKLTEDELTLGGLLTMPYVRVSDSEINQYLNE